MATQPYIVVRLVPDSPVDGATFGTYLDDLQLQAFNAYPPGNAISDFAYFSPLILLQLPFLSNFLSLVSAPTSASTKYDKPSNNYGTTLQFDSTDAISVGSYVFSSDQTTIPPGSNLQVVQVTGATATNPNTVTLNNPLPKYVPAGTVVTFLGEAPSNTTTSGAAISFSLPTNAAAATLDTPPKTTGSATDPLRLLYFADATGVTVGMEISDGASVASGTTVAQVIPKSAATPASTTVLASQGLSGSPSSVTFTLNPPYASFSVTPLSGSPAANPTSLKFKTTGPNTTNGIAAGMTLAPIAGLVAAGTTVLEVTSTTVTLSQKLLEALPSGQAITFTFPLSNGIVQHYEVLVDGNAFPGIVIAPAAVATAIIPLNLPTPAPDYVDIVIGASRGTEVIPVNNTFYNVLLDTDTIPSPDQYQFIPSTETSLYVTLPPQPGTEPISLTIPTDGSAPPYEALFQAVVTAVNNDQFMGAIPPANPLTLIAGLVSNPSNCQRIAYDIIWSYQNTLPAPPDPLESLYTNPPNTGGSANNSSSGSTSTNSLETDRQKFEGTLTSFYSTRDANAQRLTKFIAALSAAIFCEQTSLNSTSALVEFPVDPAQSFSTEVESEILIQGIGGTSGISFGVPAAFFYALGASLDQTTTAISRFQLATGDTIERLLQQFATAENSNVLNADSQTFSNGSTGITSFQAARRLVALGVSTASTSATVNVATANSSFQSLISAWLTAVPPVVTPAPNPPLTYENTDYDIWTGPLVSSDPTGYLYLDLYAVTQGFVINPSATPPTTLADKIAAWLPTTTSPATPTPTVETLKQVSAAQWTSFFQPNPTWLPPFTQPIAPGSNPAAVPGQTDQKPGYIAMRIRAFIRAVQEFFTVSSVATTAELLAPNAAPIFNLPSYDPIGLAVDNLNPFTFASATSAAQLTSGLTSAGQNVFPNDPAAEAWLAQAMTTINELDEIASVVPNPPTPGYSLPYPVSFSFSVMEALYARGFRGAKDIAILSPSDFEQAMTGTVAYAFANSATNSLYQKAQSLALLTSTSTGPTGGSFQPINPDGSLVNCVPPPCLSPDGPVAYLQEMLKLSQASTCANPWATPASGQTTLGDAVKTRRGPLGTLLATCANLETPLPLIDLVNECLEYLGTAPTAPGGTVYDTSADKLAGYALCKERDCSTEKDCHDPAAIHAALPAYSTPATPVNGTNSTVEPLVYNNLEVDFSSCDLPYSQALDVSRTYLRHFGTCRFEELRTFRKCIAEFALDPANPPSRFQSFLWRYPVRIETAIEYLGISPEEYSLLFQGTPSQPCGTPPPNSLAGRNGISTSAMYGFSAAATDKSWINQVSVLSEFLCRTCLSYCEFLELSKAVFPPVKPGDDSRKANTVYPDCEPCCLKDYSLPLPDGDAAELSLCQLALLVRLWRKLKDVCGARYTFDQLYDICTVFKLFNGTALNPEFIRQLAAFQMLRDQFNLPLVDPADKTTGTTGADRTHLLALWVGSGAKKWNWAVGQFVNGVESHARLRYACERPRGEAVAHMADNLDALSRLAGFNPAAPSTDTWNSTPGCTLRFAEALAKICASKFSIGQLLYLFNAVTPQDRPNPFELQDPEDALNYPLDLPENDQHYSLWKLREQLLAVEVREEDCEWTWPRLLAEFRARFGYAPPKGQDPLLSIGQHFFPDVLAASGFSVSAAQRWYRTPLTSSAPWNLPPAGPFEYDSASSQLSIQVPVDDAAVAAQLSQMPQLNAAEQAAAQDLYFAPRADLALVAFLFPDWQEAETHLIEERDEAKRWSSFRRHFALANARRKVIAEHLAKHVEHRCGTCSGDLPEVAGVVLSSLLADENTGTPWDSDTGAPPSVLWTPPPLGGAIPALLGLVGTGLLGQYQLPQSQVLVDSANDPNARATASNSQVIWREVRGPMVAFGRQRDLTNAPVPTVLPALAFSSAANPLITLHNGYAVEASDGLRLGGAEAFEVCWSGVLLIECEGDYAFDAGADQKSQWRVTLKRGQKTWVVLNHNWPGDTSPEKCVPRLRRGAYQIAIEFSRPAPDFTASGLHPQHTGFEVKYAGPDSGDCLVALPLHRLYRDFKDSTLDQGIVFLAGSKNAQAFLKAFYTSTIRDIRRTYQRAFKAVLFSGKLALSARPTDDHQTELGYLLSNPENFEGYAYYRTSPTAFTDHVVYFDLNFLPLQDNYHAPTAVPGDRSDPTLQQTQAMFDWFERLFDFDRVRSEVHPIGKGPLWQLFQEAQDDPPTNVAQLLRYIGADPKIAPLDLRYYQDQNTAIYPVTDDDLEDERWLVRVWHADRWIRRVLDRFHPKDISKARPDLWASQDPSAPMSASGLTQTGNANLAAFLDDGYLDNGQPRSYADVNRLNDELRERGRNALVSYLCADGRVKLPWISATAAATVPGDLSALLLMDVEAGVCEKASRIEEAITAVQTFVRRSRLGLEPDWKVSCEFVRLWDSRFDTFYTWQRCKRRELYCENWIEWTELGKARRIEAFRFLESELRTSTLTLAAPGGLDWWADGDQSLEHPELIQRRVPSELQAVSQAPATSREGLTILGSTEYSARPSWLAAAPQPSATNPPSQSFAKAVAAGATTPQMVPLWMESAIKLGTTFVRVAAAGIPPASLGFVPHGDEPQSACCHQCGHEHPVLVDEYYFWLINCEYYAYTDQTDSSSANASFTGSYQFGFQDSYYSQFQQQSSEWNDETQVPSLLASWLPQPAVRLAWCRVHNGQFGQLRRSQDYVPIATPADLSFLGRAGDSLYFQVTGSQKPPVGYEGTGDDPSPPGFRYDLPPDEAIALPQVMKPPAPTITYPGGLSSYPFFAYHDPGARLFPDSWFSASMTVADALRAHCRFEPALKWYERAFNPLQSDCTWMDCSSQGTTTVGATIGTVEGSTGSATGSNTVTGVVVGVEFTAVAQPAPNQPAPAPTKPPSACCDTTKVTPQVARNRALTLHYCQTLLDWGDAVMRRKRSPEAFQQARLIFDTVAMIAGRCPQTILLAEPASAQPVSSFTPAYAPLNPRLLDLYSFVDDRLGLIRLCLDARRLHNGRPGLDMPYFGDSPWRDGWRSIPECCAENGEWCHRPNPYRFLFQVQKANEIVGRVRELGSALLSAYEKGDAEALASIHAEQEREMLALGISIRQDQWRDADWQVQVLQQTKDVSQTNLLYYNSLYQAGLINDEIQNINLVTNALQTRTSANITEAIGEVFKIIPDTYVGAMSTFAQLPTGTKLAGLFESIAKIMQTVADIQSTTAAIDLTEAGWQRRSDEWFHQMTVLPIEIQQVELQILGAQRRRDQAMQELNNQQRQFEHATDIQDFLRDKFTAADLYLWLQKETSALYREMYELARRAACEAERAYNFERGHTTRRFLPEEPWDNLHAGLLAGERLDLALRRMEKAYLDENVREYELTKHFSLRLHFPFEFVRLKTTGRCDIELPEWMFDLDYPGQYMRRIKNISLTIPCVTGPYTGVHCRATLLSSRTRIDPRPDPPATHCCCECASGDSYEACPHDPRVVYEYGAKEAIATSSGQNDTGVFDLRADERYAPFEFHGAVCRLRLELPAENNYFPMETLTDVVVHVNYTSREGGEMLRRVASDAARKHLPGSGWCFFDVRHEFPDAWQLLRDSSRLDLRLDRRMFPFVPGAGEVSIASMAILFTARGRDGCDPPRLRECPCPPEGKPACQVLEFTSGPQRHGSPLRVSCMTSEEWPDLYFGLVDAHVGPFGRPGQRSDVGFRFPPDIGELERVFLLCRYQVSSCAPEREIDR